MRTAWIVAGSTLAIALILFGVTYVEYSVWVECRQTNSWLYCFRLISR